MGFWRRDSTGNKKEYVLLPTEWDRYNLFEPIQCLEDDVSWADKLDACCKFT
jgi:hypothetical protein